MLLSLLLAGVLAGAPQSSPLPTHAEAEELALAGQHEEALEAFQRIAAEHPRDLEARLWIARLHEWMGHPARAEAVYRGVLLEDAGNVTAMLGCGSALTSLGLYDEALEALDQAERTAPEDPEVLAALGVAYRQAGRTTRSLSYLRRAVAARPTPQNLDSLEQTRLRHGHRVESTSFFENFNVRQVADTRTGDLSVNLRAHDRLRLFGRGQVQRKFGYRDERGGVGFEWLWRPTTTISAEGLLGTGNDVLPEREAALALAHAHGPAEWTLAYRRIGFAGANVTVLSPGINWYYSHRLLLALSYHIAVTSFDAGTAAQETHSAWVRGEYLLQPRTTLILGYARNVENFDSLSPDRLGAFDAHTASAGFRVDLRTLTSLTGSYEYQWRANNVEMGRFSLAIAQRF